MRMSDRARRFRDTTALFTLVVLFGILAPFQQRHLLLATDADRSKAWIDQAAPEQDVVGEMKDPVYIPKELPEHQDRRARRTLRLLATAYSSDPRETDGSPYITATGTVVRWGVAASNFLPIGTEFKIPKLYGNEVFRVEDTHSKRLSTRIDLWHPSRKEAIAFGAKYNVEIEILER